MPSLNQSLVHLDANRYQRIDTKMPVSEPPFKPSLPPEPPTGIRRSTIMISSLPIISTNVDGVLRQFYGGGNFPTRRLIAP